MKCCLCLYTRSGLAEDAITVIRGYAVCADHMGYVAQGTDWYHTLSAAKENN